MKRPSDIAMSNFCFVARALLVTCALTPALAQQNQNSRGGIVDDWTHRHVIFSNPGPLMDALMNGRRVEWERIVTEPRYRMQQIKRNNAWAGQTAAPRFTFPEASESDLPIWDSDYGKADRRRRKRIPRQKKLLHADWSVPLSGGSGFGVAPDMYPAKFTFAPVGDPDCTNDFVVFPINNSGSSTQANILAVNNLYGTTCTGTVPTSLFAYNVGTGIIQTSPVLSLDGTKVAFVESIAGGSIFHVLTMDKSGNSGCPSSSPCNGNASSSPAVPGVNNSAVDVAIIMSGGVMVTRSSPFVDYSGDIAYVGDDSGVLHKFTGVFTGTPVEVTTSPWPFAVAPGAILTGPVFDSGASQSIFVGGSDANLYCVTSAGAACDTPSITVGSGAILDAPIVDSTEETVFATSNSGANAILTQATTGFDIQINLRLGDHGTDLYNGAFDNAYFTNVGTGHMYFCGNLAGAATPELYQVPFSSSGLFSPPATAVFQLVQSGNAGTGVDCTPLTEAFNSSQGKDYLFLGVKNHGFTSGTPNCASLTCVMSFSLPTASPFTFPTAANSTLTTTLGTNGISGIILDNVSGATGASQIYFGNLQTNAGVQVSQSALQ
jgi:hypothetical protein